MAELVIAIGLPASGKSTYYEENYVDEDMVHISSDAIREEVFGDVNDQTHNGEVFNIMFNRVVESLKNDESVYYDATNISRKRRMNFIKEVKNAVKKDIHVVGLVFAYPIEVIKERNSKRGRVVPEEVIDRMLRNFEVPYKAEGFDELFLHRGSPQTYALNHLVDDLKLLPHDNPHHSLTVGEHMIQAQRMYIKEACEYSYVISRALRYHDIGKGLTKQFKDAKGNASDIAHFYNHENVGAYLYLSMAEKTAIFDIALLINHHMDYFKGEKYLRKMELIYGKEFVADLFLINQYDKAAHGEEYKI